MMTTSSHPGAGSFHEWPLVVFTTLAIMGAGLLATPLVAWLAAGATASAAGTVRWGALLLGAGLVVSTVHLGRPFRAPLASLGLGRSRLSAEVVVTGVALLLGIATALLPHVSPVLDLTTAAAAAALLVTLGLVYALPGQQTWRGAVVWMPLTTGVAFAAVALAAFRGEASVAIGAVATAALAADTALVVVRRMSLVRPKTPLAPRYPSVFARRQVLLAARFALVDILPGCCLLAGLPAAAAGLLGLGILVDRVAFYGFASQHTTEAEVRQVEAVIGSRV
jgi:anaerobic dimethyl sulfoxide reductase subunit C (anchor subunit)